MAKLLDLLEELTNRALAKGADQAEAFGQRFDSREVWLEANRIKMVKSLPGHGIGLRVIKKNTLGFASINQLDEACFDELVDKALALASANLKDKHLVIPEPKPVAPLKGLYDPKLEELPLKEVISMTKRLLAAARDYDKRVTVDSGGVYVNIGEKTVYNSHCLSAYERGTDITAVIMGMARDKDEVSAFDFQFDGALRLSKIKIEPLAKEFALNVINSLGAKPARSFKGTVIFSPNAVSDTLLFPLIYSINAQNVQKGMSRLAGKLGERIASTKLSVIDDGLLAGGLATSAFDREGQPRQTTKIIDKGKLKTYLHNSYTAGRDGVKSTGHASGGYRSLPGISTTNLIISPGEATKAELIHSVKEGILVTRFSGNANPVTGDFSGTVKGGFYVKNGRVAHPVTNTMIAGNVFEAIGNIKGISKKLTKVFAYQLPYITVGGISVTSG